MSGFEADIRAALLDPERPIPKALQDARGGPAGKRFSVYRNNVTVSLIEALRVAFPLLTKLVGDAFDPLALSYLRRHPPSSPLMMHYGEEMPEFLRSYTSLAHIGYLPDCAKLDLALRRSYHAADATLLAPEDLHLVPDALLALRLRFAPSAILIRSKWPLHDIWRFTMMDGVEKPRAIAQDVLVSRREFDPAPFLLPPGAATWLEALQVGESLSEADDFARSEYPEFDLAGALHLALDAGALILSPDPETS